MYDYMRLDVPHTFPRGLDGEVFSYNALERAFILVQQMKEEAERFPPLTSQPALQSAPAPENVRMYSEHVTYFIYNRPEIFKSLLLTGGELFRRNYRLCIDTDTDFLLVSKIFKHFQNIYPKASEVIEYLDANPKIACINSEIRQRF
jgi:spore coat polysaccharide biosynthesis protein SpsF